MPGRVRRFQQNPGQRGILSKISDNSSLTRIIATDTAERFVEAMYSANIPVIQRKVNRIVAISPPDNVRHLTQKFFTALDIGPRVQEIFNRKFEAQFGADLWQRFAPEVLARQLDVPGLVIHDQNDRDVPIEEGVAVARAWPGAQFARTTGLGHRRILRDPEVIARVAAFIAA